MQMGVGERQDIASGWHSASPEDVARRAHHMHGLMTPMARDNLVVEEMMICCGYILASNLMMICHSGMDMAEMTGKHCGSVGDLRLGTDRVSALPLNGNSVEMPFQMAGHWKRRKNRRKNTVMQARWERRVVIPGLGGSSPHWRRCKACVGWTCSTVKQGRRWVALNYCAAGCCDS